MHGVLTTGFSQLLADSTLLVRYFNEQWQLSLTEAQEIAKYFVDHPPKIVHGYARTNLVPPILSIILAQENEDEHVLSAEGEMIDDPEDPDLGTDIYSSVWTHSYQILILAENPDLTTYYYEVAKRLLFLAKPLLAKELFDIRLGGQDLAPDPQYTGEMLWARTLTLSCRAVLEVPNLETKEGRAWKVSGIAVDSGGSPRDVGGVKTLITVQESVDDSET